MDSNRPHIVVLGAGFGGLTFCREFSYPAARITVVDKQNHHLFQPLLYQVATAGLSAPDIAQPIRSILSDQTNVTVLLDHVLEIQLNERVVRCEQSELHYDYLVIALGGVTSYFGHPEWEQFAPGLKTLDDAFEVRRRTLLAFERAETASSQTERDRLLTMVVVGGGPTGVELAGAFIELARHVLMNDFRHIDPRKARVVLIEAAPRILASYPPELSGSAEDQLRSMGVEVRVNTRVHQITQGRVLIEKDEEEIAAENIVWAAGVAASPVARQLGVATDRAGRIKVSNDLSVPGHPEAFVIGDMASVTDQDGRPVPGTAPAAMQMARHVADVIARETMRRSSSQCDRPAFIYWDKGSMATIGRSAAVAQIGKLQFSGFPAWFAWLAVHLIFLVGFRNRAAVLFNWAYSYLTYKKGARIITGLKEGAKAPFSA